MVAGNVAFGHNAGHGVEGSHQLVSVPREEGAFDVLWAEGPTVLLPSESEGSAPSGGASFWQCPLLEVAVAVSELLGDFFGVGNWRFVEQGGAGLGESVLLRQGRGPVVSSLKVAHIVVRSVACSSDSSYCFRFLWSSFHWHPRAYFRTFVARRWRIVCCSVCLLVRFGPTSGDTRGWSRPRCHCVTQVSAAFGVCGIGMVKGGPVLEEMSRQQTAQIKCGVSCRPTTAPGPGLTEVQCTASPRVP